MKKTLLCLALVAASLSAAAQTAHSATAPADRPQPLAATVRELLNTSDPAILLADVAQLERAAAVAPQDWLPRYYRAYALTVSTFASKEDGAAKDQALDQAEAALTQARQLGGDQSELLALQALIYQARIRVDFMTRGQEYSERATEAATQARALNPANPRPYLILANNVYYTPAAYGGGPVVARPLLEEAKAKFDAFRPASPLAPNWGKSQVLDHLKTYETTAAN